MESGGASSSSTYMFNVFLSFSGEDTRYEFTSYLHFFLKYWCRFKAFFDEFDLAKGSGITSGLLAAIQGSETAVIVLSKNYPCSSFCLDELVGIMDCVHGNGRLVIPVFYKVDPSHVRNLTGIFGEALVAHENKFKKAAAADTEEEEEIKLNENMERLKKWKIALKLLANLSGHHIRQIGYKHEREYIIEIMQDVSKKIGGGVISPHILPQIEFNPRVDPLAPASYEYDVYLSFRGEDTRFGFTRHLYSALTKKGIRTFIDDLDLDTGKDIAPTLFKEIEGSRIAIVVLSENYASSSFCLDELVTIMDCVKGKGRCVLPVFYQVDPSHVRRQRGTYATAFATHEQRLFEDNSQRLQRWRLALRQVANLSGYDFRHGYFNEPKFIENIVEDVLKKITHAALPVDIHPSLLNVQSNDLRMSRIHERINRIEQSTTTILSIVQDIVHHVGYNAKHFPDVSNIEVFEGQNFKRWQERVLSVLTTHGVAYALTDLRPESSDGPEKLAHWIHANKVCRHTILTNLSPDLFDVYCSGDEANKIWESMILKYTAEDARRKKVMVNNYNSWKMTDEMNIRDQINEHQKLLDNLKEENIILPDEFVVGTLIEKLPDSWKLYKQQLKHKNEQLSLEDLIKHIIIEDKNRKKIIGQLSWPNSSSEGCLIFIKAIYAFVLRNVGFQ